MMHSYKSACIMWITAFFVMLCAYILESSKNSDIVSMDPNHYIVLQTASIPVDHPYSGDKQKLLWVGKGTRIIVVSREAVLTEPEDYEDGR